MTVLCLVYTDYSPVLYYQIEVQMGFILGLHKVAGTQLWSLICSLKECTAAGNYQKQGQTSQSGNCVQYVCTHCGGILTAAQTHSPKLKFINTTNLLCNCTLATSSALTDLSPINILPYSHTKFAVLWTRLFFPLILCYYSFPPYSTFSQITIK